MVWPPGSRQRICNRDLYPVEGLGQHGSHLRDAQPLSEPPQEALAPPLPALTQALGRAVLVWEGTMSPSSRSTFRHAVVGFYPVALSPSSCFVPCARPGQAAMGTPTVVWRYHIGPEF